MQHVSFRSQHGEDRILANEFKDRASGYYVEVGAYNGESYSNTFHFEKALGWTGILVEADPELAKKCVAVRPNSKVVNCAASFPGSPPEVTFEVVEGCQWVSSLSVTKEMLKRIEDIPTTIRKVTVPAKTLDSILEENGAPSQIDFITIDVEGHELAVLKGFTPKRWNPKSLILERNDHFPDPGIMRYMKEHKFHWQRTTGCNDWFIFAGTGSNAAYQTNLAVCYYLPKYLTVYKPFLNGPVKRAAKWAMRRVGVLDIVRNFKRKRQHAA